MIRSILLLITAISIPLYSAAEEEEIPLEEEEEEVADRDGERPTLYDWNQQNVRERYERLYREHERCRSRYHRE